MGASGSKDGGGTVPALPITVQAASSKKEASLPAAASTKESASSTAVLSKVNDVSTGNAGGGKSARKVDAPSSKSVAVAAAKKAAAARSAKAGAGGALPPKYRFKAIRDTFKSLDEIADALHDCGLESSNLICAIDFTKSNQWTGRYTFGGRSLHWVDPENEVRNPYMLGIEVIGKVLAVYDDDNLIPVFGFGDSTTLDRSVFPFFPDRPARGFEEVLARYKELVPKVVMAGPTNFAPAIEAACVIVAQTRMYHILIIIADGQVTNRAHTEAAIVRASELPLSIILVGVGDGPWDTMDDFDDNLPDRRFDNFQFVNMVKVMQENPDNKEVAFAIAALMEIPEQYAAIRELGYI